MRALILFSREGKVSNWASRLAKQLEKDNVQVDLKECEMSGGTPIPCAQYKVICVASPTVGPIGGKIAADVEPTLKRCTRIEGKEAVAFVTPKLLGTAKSLKQLMQKLEKQGAMVQDFASIGSEKDLEKFAGRVADLLRR